MLLVHTWLGLDEGVKHRTERVAELGYAAFALDIFGPNVHPTPPVESAAVIKPFVENRQLFRQRLEAGLKVLQKQPECDASRVAAIGYCFGGCGVLEMARAGFTLKGVVSLHGELATPLPAKPGNIKPKILVLHGDADPRVSQDQVTHFLDEMRQAGSNWEFTAYSGAKHSFTGEGIGGKDGSGSSVQSASGSALLASYDEFSERSSPDMIESHFSNHLLSVKAVLLEAFLLERESQRSSV